MARPRRPLKWTHFGTGPDIRIARCWAEEVRCPASRVGGGGVHGASVHALTDRRGQTFAVPGTVLFAAFRADGTPGEAVGPLVQDNGDVLRQARPAPHAAYGWVTGTRGYVSFPTKSRSVRCSPQCLCTLPSLKTAQKEREREERDPVHCIDTERERERETYGHRPHST